MRQTISRRSTIINNLLWFLGSLVLAFIVWMFAVTQSDPFEQFRLVERVPIRIAPDAGLIVTNAADISTTAAIQLRAQRSVRQSLAPDDVNVWVDLSGRGPGEHTIPLQYRVVPERNAFVTSITPRQLTVRLELEQSKLVPVREIVTSEPALAYTLESIEFDARQVTVTGPESRVSQVVEVQVPLDLAGMRVAFEDDVRPVAVDVDGNTVPNVTLEPSVVHATVDIRPRADVREVRVQPNVVGELPNGYVLTGFFEYEPNVVVVSGPTEVLNELPGTFFTEPIDLSERRSSFEVSVRVELPDPSLVVITGGVINVEVGVQAQTTTHQYDRVAVNIIGQRAGLNYELATNEVTVLITGPQPVLADLAQGNVTALVDVSQFSAPGTYQLEPSASIGSGQSAVSIQVLPEQIDVEISVAGETPEVTPES